LKDSFAILLYDVTLNLILVVTMLKETLEKKKLKKSYHHFYLFKAGHKILIDVTLIL